MKTTFPQSAPISVCSQKSKPTPRQNEVTHAAKSGKFNNIDLKATDFEFNSGDNTIAHIAARNGHLDKMAHLLTKEIVASRNLRRDTVAHVAARFGHFEQIPKKCLSPELMNQSLNNQNFTPQQTLDRYPQDRLAHFLKRIWKGFVDADLLTVKDMLLSGPDGWTIGHAAIKKGVFGNIPAAFLTYEVLTQRTSIGLSVYDYALSLGCSEFIPGPILARLEEPAKRKTQDMAKALRSLLEGVPSKSQ